LFQEEKIFLSMHPVWERRNKEKMLRVRAGIVTLCRRVGALTRIFFRRTIETIEFSMDALAKSVDLHPKRFCVMAALLGNHILAEEELHGKENFSGSWSS
jgi:hypothetical protein